MEKLYPELPITELAKDIERQRRLIQDNSRQMVEDIEHFLLSYMNTTGMTEINLTQPYYLGIILRETGLPYVSGTAQYIEKVTLEDNGLTGENYDADIKVWYGKHSTSIKNLPPVEQAYLFEFLVQDLMKSRVFIVLEELFTPDDGTTTNVVGTFKEGKNAQQALHDRLCEIMGNHREIWEQAQQEKKHPRRNNLNEYLICTSEYIYHIRVLEQGIQDEQ